jgi:sec-independent protein translocase protein TatB
MFDFAWSEIALIGVVALIAIGPKDLPVAIRTVAQMVKKARRMAGEFQTHVDEMVREANLDEVRGQINEIRNFDFKGALNRAVDSDGTIRKTFADDPFKTSTYTPPPPVTETPAIDNAPAAPALDAPHLTSAELTAPDGRGLEGDRIPAGLPDPLALEQVAASMVAAEPPPPPPVAAPAFIPPSIASPPVAPAFIPPGTRLTPT